MKARALLDQPLLASCAGGKGHNNDSGTGGGGQSWIVHRIGVVLPFPPPKQRRDSNKGGRQVKAEATMRVITIVWQAMTMAMAMVARAMVTARVGEQATTRAMAAATLAAGNNEGNGNGDKGGERQRR